MGRTIHVKMKKITKERKASEEVGWGRKMRRTRIEKREKWKRKDGKREDAGCLCELKVSNLRSVLRQL